MITYKSKRLDLSEKATICKSSHTRYTVDWNWVYSDLTDSAYSRIHLEQRHT